MKEKTLYIAKRFSILNKVEKLEKELLKIKGVVEVDFDLSGFYDDLNQVIFLTKYDIPISIENYCQVRKQLINDVLKVANKNGLKRTEDRIEDYGEWFYFVTSCNDDWGMENLKNIMKDCLETRGYNTTEDKINELFIIYRDCQEWDNEEMLSGKSYDEIEDFVKHSPCVDEVFEEQ